MTTAKPSTPSSAQPVRDSTASQAPTRRRLADLQAEQQRLTADRDRHWDKIVRVRMEKLIAGTLVGPLTYSDRRLQTLWAEREQRAEEIDDSRTHRDKTVAARDASLQAAAAQADSDEQALARLQALFDERMARDTSYQTLARHAIQAQDTEAGLRERLVHAIDERERKTAEYLADPLFVYLHRREFGRTGYAGSGLRHRLDRWVAAVAGFAQARRDFELLQEMPRWLDEKIVATARLAEAAEQKLSTYMNSVPGIERLRVAQATAASSAAALAAKQEKAASAVEQEHRLDAEAVAFAARDDQYTREIRQVYRQAFAGQPMSALIKLAEQTGSDDDRQALQAIAAIDRRLPDVAQRIEQIRAQLAASDDESASVARQ